MKITLDRFQVGENGQRLTAKTEVPKQYLVPLLESYIHSRLRIWDYEEPEKIWNAETQAFEKSEVFMKGVVNVSMPNRAEVNAFVEGMQALWNRMQR